ncbi:MAG: right-handed parallel beta-helix repeat-containing protein [Lachnospiraceae bacterium]|nr:right-handed parallel beta-helix repeat-containing protein [Lachnospiraceae bacterium]
MSTVKNKESEVESVDGGAKGIFIYGSDEYPIGNCVFDGNTVVSDSSGIYLRYVKNTEIKGNKVDRFAGAYNVDKTTFAEDAIKLLACKEITVSENKISTVNSDRYENGIALRDNSTAKIDSNEINSTNKSGIAVYNSTAEGESNKINAAKKHGVTVQDGTLKLSSCNILGSGEHGASAQKSTMELIDCTIEKSTKNGVLVDASNVTLTKNTVSEGGAHGVSIINGGELTANGNKILDFAKNGFTIDKSTIHADGNSVIGCNKGFSVLSGSSGSITNNELFSKTNLEITVEKDINFTPSIKMLRKMDRRDSAGNVVLDSRP